MGLFDLFSKKEASDTPDNPEPRGAAPAPLDEANKALSDAAKQVGEAIKPLGEAAKPIGEAAVTHGKAFIADVSAASRDLGASFREATSPAPNQNVATAPDAPRGVEATQPEPAPSVSAPSVSAPSVSAPSVGVIAPATAVSSSMAPATSLSDASLGVDSLAPQATTAVSPADFEEQAVAWAPVESVPFSPSLARETASTSEVASTQMPTPVPVAPAVSFLATAPAVSTAPDGALVPLDAVPASLDVEGNLEELVEPLPQLAPAPLAVGATLLLGDRENQLRQLTITEVLSPRGALNAYNAQTSEGALLFLREASADSEAARKLQREGAIRQSFESPQIVKPVGEGTQEGRFYLADAAGETERTFATQLGENAPLSDQISTLTQTSAALSQLHKAGFVHAAVRPEAIILGKPVQLSGFESLSRLGQPGESAISFPGYGAPEIAAGETLDARTDVYSLGALLYRVVTGESIAETGFDEATFAPQLLLPGVPQILAKTLGPPATRYSEMSALHRDLVRLRARVRPLARFDSAGATTIGLESGRTTNQDAWGELRGQREGEDGSIEWLAWVVSDGMGGMASGEVASQTAVAAVLREAALWGAAFDGKAPTETEQAMLVKTWTREANRQAVDAMNAIGARGGCTLVCGLVIDRRMTLAHVGDCRTYLWRASELTQITRDHSYVMSLVLQGEITREQMRDHPDRSKITRSLGDRHPLPDYFVDGLEVETKSPALDLQRDDVVLAFSDGVWEPVLENEMKRILLASGSLEAAAHELIDAAMRAGGPDNATAYLLQMAESAPIIVNVE